MWGLAAVYPFGRSRYISYVALVPGCYNTRCRFATIRSHSAARCPSTSALHTQHTHIHITYILRFAAARPTHPSCSNSTATLSFSTRRLSKSVFVVAIVSSTSPKDSSSFSKPSLTFSWLLSAT